MKSVEIESDRMRLGEIVLDLIGWVAMVMGRMDVGVGSQFFLILRMGRANLFP